MFMTKLKIAAAVLCVGSLLACAVGMAASRGFGPVDDSPVAVGASKSPSGRRALSGSADRTLRLWRLPDPPPLRQEDRDRARSKDNLFQIGTALHNYHSKHKTFPPAAIYSKDGKRPLLSWRVAILPFLGEGQLFEQFKRDEPWDSDHNKKLLEQMPRVFAPVGVKAKGPVTFYQAFVGEEAAFQADKGLRLVDFMDGTSNTALVAEAAEPVPWTKPLDLPYDAGKPLPKLGGLFQGHFHALFADGKVYFVPGDTPKATLRAIITPRGGELIEFEFREGGKPRDGKESGTIRNSRPR